MPISLALGSHNIGTIMATSCLISKLGTTEQPEVLIIDVTTLLSLAIIV